VSKIKLRRDLAANWESINPVLSSGEPGFDLTSKKLKIGNGITAWNALPYVSSDNTATPGPQGVQGPQGIKGDQGDQGIQGPRGLQGSRGAQGIQGIQGLRGSTGTQGIQGLQGAQGAAVRLLGTVTDFTSLPGSAEIGDGYITIDTGDLWFWGTNTQWYDVGRIVGPQGIQGIQGPQGPQGNTGTQGIQGPQGPQGESGIQGPSGNTGTQGIQGPQGLQGLQGLVGPGVASGGTIGQILVKASSSDYDTAWSIPSTIAFTVTNISYFTNDVGYITSASEFTITNVSHFINDVGYITSTSSLINGTATFSLNTAGTLISPGSIIPNANLSYDLGSTSSQWRSLYVGTGTIYIGGVALGVNQDNYVTVDGNPIITLNTAGNITLQGNNIVGTVTISDTAPVVNTGTQWFNTVEGRTYIAANGLWLDSNPTQIPSPETYLDGLAIDGTIISTANVDSDAIVVDGGDNTKLSVSNNSVKIQTPGEQTRSFWVAEYGGITTATTTSTFTLGTGAFYDSLGNVYVLGAIQYGDFNFNNVDSLFLKYDTNGNLLWHRTWHDDGGYNCGTVNQAFAIDSNDRIYWLATDATGYNCWTGYFDTDGNLGLGGTAQQSLGFINGSLSATDIACDNSGNYYIAGSYYNSNDTPVVIKIDGDTGNVIWNGNIIPEDFEDLPSFGRYRAVTVNPVSGDVWAIGDYDDDGGLYAMLSKWDINGTHQWTKKLVTQTGDIASAVIFNSGFVYTIVNDDGEQKAVVSKFDTDGVLIWASDLAVGAVDPIANYLENSGAYDLSFDANGNVYVTGIIPSINSTNQLWITKLDPSNGEMLYSRVLGTQSGVAIIDGSTYGFNNAIGHRVGDIYEDKIAVTAITPSDINDNTSTNEIRIIVAQLPIDGSIVGTFDNVSILDITNDLNSICSTGTYTVTTLMWSTATAETLQSTSTLGISYVTDIIGLSGETISLDSVSRSSTVTNTWTFVNNNIILPPGGDILNSNGVSVLGATNGTAANGWQITSGTYNVSVADTGVVTMATSRGNIEFGALPECIGGVSHFHIMKAVDSDAVDLYFGDDYNYVLQRGNSASELAGNTNDYGVEIGTRDLSTETSTQHVWRFGTDGVLTLSTASTILGNNNDPNIYIETATTSTTSTWTFGTDGLLTLPAATPIIRGGGTGTDVTVIATTGTNTATWTFAADGSINVGQAQGFIVRTMTGANASPSNYVSTFEFGVDGTLILPQGSVIGEINNTTVITPPGALAGQGLAIRTTAGGGLQSANTFTPGGTIIVTFVDNGAHFSDSQISGESNTWTYTITGISQADLGSPLTGVFLGENWTIVNSTNVNTATFNIPALSNGTGFTITLDKIMTQPPFNLGTSVILDSNGRNSLTIGSIPEISHVHLTSVDPSTVDLFLGDDDQYVKIEKNHGDVVIGTGMIGVPTGLDNWIGDGGWDSTPYINTATTGGSGTGLTVNVNSSNGGYIDINSITIANPGIGYTVGDVITINNENDLPGTFTISTVTNSSNNWTFAAAGNLTVPASSAIKGVDGNIGSSINFYGGQGQYGGGDVNISGGFTSTGTGGIVSIIGGGSGDGNASWGYIILGTGGEFEWYFEVDGTLTLPALNSTIKAGGQTGTDITIVASTITNSTWTFSKDGTLASPVLTIATLPSATPAGQRAFISDAVSSPTWGATVSSTGTDTYPVWSDGSIWKYG
jgi:hypothetical protein